MKEIHVSLLIKDDNEKQQAQREKRIDQIIDEMRSYKRTSTPVLLKDKGRMTIASSSSVCISTENFHFSFTFTDGEQTSFNRR